MRRTTTTGLERLDTRYGTMLVLPKDSGAAYLSLKAYGEWAENELSFIRRFVSSGSVVLDVGAYVGTHTMAFASYVGPQGKVISIEAQPRSYQVLSTNIDINGLTTVTAHHAIASNVSGDVVIPVLDVERASSFGSSSLQNVLRPQKGDTAAQAARSQAVRALTLDSLRLPQCDLIKIDVEGVEDLVLEGAAETIRRCGPAVYCECNSVEDGLRSVAILRCVGYRIHAHVVRAFNDANFNHNPENIFGRACEVALIGLPPGREELLHAIPPRPVELVLEITTADDLVLALLIKPQYAKEILRPSAAAQSGGAVHLDRMVAQCLRLEALENESRALHAKIREFEGRLAAHARERDLEIQSGEERLRKFTDEKNAEIAAYEQRLAALHAKVIEESLAFKSRLATLTREKDVEIQSSEERLKKFADEKNDEIATYEQRLAALQAGKRREADSYEGRLSRVSQHLSLITDQACVARREANKSAKETAELRAILAQGEAKIARNEARTAEIEARLQALHNSTSWKLTEPLRRVVRLLKADWMKRS